MGDAGGQMGNDGGGWLEGGAASVFFWGGINNNLNFLPSLFFSFLPFSLLDLLLYFVLFGGCFVLILDVIWFFFFSRSELTDRCRGESGHGWKWMVNS